MKKILLIQTGGTISMDVSNDEHALDPNAWSDVLRKEVPELSQLADLTSEDLFYEDSSDFNRSHWIRLAEFIYDKYDYYDGFVILHGTDTMAYTASALSFALQHLSKPIIMTGSQVPMSNIRSDARRNLVNAIEMATMPLNEVAICFNDYVYRGNRATKMSIGDFDAFGSPNYQPLAEIGLNIELNNREQLISDEPLRLNTRFDNRLFVLKIYPGLNPDYLFKLGLHRLRAIVVEAFGSGNFPVKGEYSLLPFLRKCREHNIIVAVTSQAAYDAVDLSKYSSGREALKLGALSARDMTTEATVTKLMYLLGNYDSQDTVSELFQTSLAGEITE